MIFRGHGRTGAGLVRQCVPLLVALSVCGYRAGAQAENGKTLTLHVYANLVQLPTLVLDWQRRPMPRIDPSLFELSLDSGQRFAPTHVRMEGEDPIDLAILVDLSGSQRSLLKSLPEAMAALVPGSLHPQDRVSVYAVNCSLVSYVRDAPPEEALLKRAVTDAVQRSASGAVHPASSCGKPAHLWAAMATVVQQLADAPGRRVLLVLSDGADGGSTVSLPMLHTFAGWRGVALFGLIDVNDLAVRDLTRDAVPVQFRQLCEGTGGVVIQSSEHKLAVQLQQFVAMLRGRYILEFPRPSRISGGMHDVDVKLRRKHNAFITVAGVTVALPDPKVLNDPTTVPSDAGADIPVGDRKR